MPATPVLIGSSATVSGGKITITVGAGGVPAGVQIFCAFAENSASGTATCADTAGNTYGIAGTQNVSVGAYIFRERTGLALVNSNTIVITLSGGATLGAVSVFYVPDLVNAIVDTHVDATGTSATPSVTSGVPTSPGDFFLGVVAGSSVITTATQDSTHEAWASPPGVVEVAAPVLVGGTVLKSAKAAATYAPTFNVSDVWAATISGYLVQRPDMNSQSIMMS
jgi:hypothetical protein